jgi:hypothetical protein
VLRLARRTSCLPGFFGGLGLRPASLIFQPKPLEPAWSCFFALALPLRTYLILTQELIAALRLRSVCSKPGIPVFSRWMDCPKYGVSTRL